MTINVYFAAPLFSEMEQLYNTHVAERIRRDIPQINLFVPQEQGEINDKEEYADSVQIAQFDTDALLESDLLIAVLDGQTIDPGVASEVGVAFQAGIPIVGVYTDSRQDGATNEEKLEALQVRGENQFHYVNLYTVGLIKQRGALVASTRELLSYLDYFVKTTSPAGESLVDFARNQYNLLIKESFALTDYGVSLDDDIYLTYTLPLTASSTEHPLVMSFKDFETQVADDDHTSTLACYIENTKQLYDDLHDPHCSSFTFDFYERVFNLFKDLINHYTPSDKSYPLDTTWLTDFQKEHRKHPYIYNYFDISNTLDIAHDVGGMLDHLAEHVIPSIVCSDARSVRAKNVIEALDLDALSKTKGEIINDLDRLCLDYLAVLLIMLANHLEAILEDQDYVYQK